MSESVDWDAVHAAAQEALAAFAAEVLRHQPAAAVTPGRGAVAHIPLLSCVRFDAAGGRTVLVEVCCNEFEDVVEAECQINDGGDPPRVVSALNRRAVIPADTADVVGLVRYVAGPLPLFAPAVAARLGAAVPGVPSTGE